MLKNRSCSKIETKNISVGNIKNTTNMNYQGEKGIYIVNPKIANG